MQLQYEHLDYQKQAIFSIVDLFQGEINHNQDNFSLVEKDYTRVIANKLLLSYDDIGKNLKRIQTQNNIALSENLENLHFSVEMETGTGKTFVYLNTIFELNKRYGWRKFMIIVPSVAIREGVLQTLNSTKTYFNEQFNSPIYHYYEYSGQKTNLLKQFATSHHIEILVINIQSFEKESNIINQERENGVLMDLIRAVNPIVMIDEPQNISSDKRKNAIANLNPLFTVGYSATHREIINKVYSLNPVQAFEQGLVKQIAVRSVIGENNYNDLFIELVEVVNNKGLKAKIKIHVNDTNQMKEKIVTVKQDSDLYKLSNHNPVYQNIRIGSIDLANQQVELSNGQTISKSNHINAMQDEIAKEQIRQTIIEHLEREKILKPKGIKVLSLFFIDKVEHYRTNQHGEMGKYYLWFEEIYQQLTKQSADGVHNGYFSQDRKDKHLKTDKSKEEATYNLIMKDKERLLSFDEPVRFIFSHSALREGWDNPNVFQICTLNESNSLIKKRQEIGRGLRLPVNQYGERIYNDDEVNILTIIPNESYEVFAKKLQQEYEDECGLKFEQSNIKDSRQKKTVTYRYDAFTDPLFLEIWQKINQKVSYQVNYDSDELIHNASHALKDIQLSAPKLVIKKANIRQSNQGIVGTEIYSANQNVNLAFNLPDIFKAMQDRTGLTRKTLFSILKMADVFEKIKLNPQSFIDIACEIINRELQKLMVNGIQYHRLLEEYEQSIFQNYEIYANQYTFEVDTAKINKTIYNGYLDLDSKTEHQFATDCENFDKQVKFYFKLPKKFKIPTPIGNYNPDWAVVVDKAQNVDSPDYVYFVAETKNTGKNIQEGIVIEQLSPDEQFKIACAKRLFDKIDNMQYGVVEKVDELMK